jgi:hypothetical protein
MARDGERQCVREIRSALEHDLAEAEANIRVLVEAELEAEHELDPHAPRVDECPVCRRLGLGA